MRVEVARRSRRGRCLEGEHAADGLVDPRLRQATVAHGAAQALDELDLPRQVAAVVVVVLLGEHEDVHARR